MDEAAASDGEVTSGFAKKKGGLKLGNFVLKFAGKLDGFFGIGFEENLLKKAIDFGTAEAAKVAAAGSGESRMPDRALIAADFKLPSENDGIKVRFGE